jgi:hypothetical protein
MDMISGRRSPDQGAQGAVGCSGPQKNTTQLPFTKTPIGKHLPTRKASLWKPPFSVSYYKRITTTGPRRTADGNNRRIKWNFTGQWGRKAKSVRQKVSVGKLLLQFGFQIFKPIAKKTKQDSDPLSLEEFSGMRISTAP